ncbi:hypothetical protein [Lysobacter auxotrophicus]|uniref:BFD-like [2Fe-2S]-binding domain-containing protein n=1 Tax=Lysobacter auxotrophicus TaxID=2992573 RepID=A0ABN6UMF6_9GAMM|nr:hypothetical protein [Lysobacter auxotrophicus]BDU16018.1 hypothetical protein LA521A_12190 [Lysobacter auxotrophicus]
MHEAPAACVCGCVDPHGAVAHTIVAALRVYDVDGAIDAGLLDRGIECTSCDDACRAQLHAARTARIGALAARERYRARNARLERRARERAEKRAAPPVSEVATPTPSALPSAAAAALARARAKAAQRHKP